jgi:hypothetical protein
MKKSGNQKRFDIDDLKDSLVPIQATFKVRGLILCDWEYFEGWNVVFIVDWEERVVRVTARRGAFVSQREHEDALEQTFYAVEAASNYQTLLVESDPATKGYKRRLLKACQEEMISAGRAAQDLLDKAPGEGEVDESVKQTVREIMVHPSNREGEWQGERVRPQSAIALTY